VGHVAHIGEIKNIYKIFIGIPEGKRQDGRPGHRWESNIRTDLRETRGEGVDWMHLRAVMNTDSTKCKETLD